MAASDAEPRPGWWRRHWKWALPAGCLGTVLVAAGVAALVLALTLNLTDETGAYQHAMQRLREAPAAARLLGTPIEAGTLVRGTVEETDGTRRARLTIPVSGERASGTLYVEAQHEAGQWTYERLELAVEDNSLRVNLLPAQAPREQQRRDSLRLDRLYEQMQRPPADSATTPPR